MLLFTILGLLFVSASAATDCGVKAARPAGQIVGGSEAAVGAWPWQLSLQIKASGVFRHTCGASILSEGWALTAAHCVHNRGGPADFRVVAGAHNVKKLTGSEQIVNIDRIIKHEDYSQISLLGYPNDICLLRLASKINLTASHVGVACLADASLGDFAGSDDCWISGWGITHWVDNDIPDVLQEANVPVPTNQQCRNAFIMLRDTHICAGKGRPSACRGDSGGPLSCKVGDKWYVSGIASFGVVFCQGVPMVYTRVSSYVDWVDNTIAANQPE